LVKALLGNDYASILDHINEKVDDILSATNLEQEEPNDEASVNISFNEIDPNLANEHGLIEDDLLAKMNEHKESDKQIDPSFEHTNLNATTIYIDIDNDLNKLS